MLEKPKMNVIRPYFIYRSMGRIFRTSVIYGQEVMKFQTYADYWVAFVLDTPRQNVERLRCVLLNCTKHQSA
jgi:hypothetical protein